MLCQGSMIRMLCQGDMLGTHIPLSFPILGRRESLDPQTCTASCSPRHDALGSTHPEDRLCRSRMQPMANHGKTRVLGAVRATSLHSTSPDFTSPGEGGNRAFSSPARRAARTSPSTGASRARCASGPGRRSSPTWCTRPFGSRTASSSSRRTRSRSPAGRYCSECCFRGSLFPRVLRRSRSCGGA